MSSYSFLSSNYFMSSNPLMSIGVNTKTRLEPLIVSSQPSRAIMARHIKSPLLHEKTFCHANTCKFLFLCFPVL